MKKYLSVFFGLGLFIAASALAATTLTYTTQSGDTLQSVAAKEGTSTAALVAMNPQIVLQKGQVLTIMQMPATLPPPPVVPPTTGEIVIKNVYTTSYGWPDNTPAGTNTTIQGVSGKAGGDGTYANPITIATGYSLAGGKETDDYAAGTIFYDPNLRKYGIIGDTCGDGNSPQTEACHKSEIANTIQLDLWAGGTSANTTKASDPLTKCEDAITRTGTLIENPASNYAVVVGPIFNNGVCATQFGDTPITQ